MCMRCAGIAGLRANQEMPRLALTSGGGVCEKQGIKRGDCRQPAAWVSRHADVVLPCYCASAETAFSGMAAASVLHLLTQHVAHKLGARAKQRESVISAIRRELDDD